jgi:uncharacterized protein with FMN-binding domain
MKKIQLIGILIISIFVLYGCSAKNNTQNGTTAATPTATPTTAAGINKTVPTTAATTNTTTPAGNTNTAATGAAAVYRDGTYDVVHKSTKPGYEEAVVTIKSGKIKSITQKRLDDNKVEVNYNKWNGSGEYPNLKKYRIDLAEDMMVKQSPEVDTISGATQSCIGWIAAVTDALKEARK